MKVFGFFFFFSKDLYLEYSWGNSPYFFERAGLYLCFFFSNYKDEQQGVITLESSLVLEKHLYRSQKRSRPRAEVELKEQLIPNCVS